MAATGSEGLGAGDEPQAMAPGGRSRIFRPSGLLVFALFVTAVGVGWWLLSDRLVERAVEVVGASLVGAKVDLESADLRLTQGSVRLLGLQVANPDAPMRNLVQADEILADLRLAPLLEKKVVIQQLTVAGVRFGTERETSGALENADSESGLLWRRVNEWAGQIEVPSLSLEGLGGAVRVDAISTDSLRTVRYAREVMGRADSLRTDWERRLETLDPRPRLDSLAVVARRIESFQLTLLNAPQVPGLVRDARAAVDRVTSLQSELADLDQSVRAGISTLGVGPDVVDELRSADLAYALRLLDIPSIEAPTISPALFSGTALVWLKPILYWTRAAERFLPPGLDPRNRPGPARTRAPGTTYDFRRGAENPRFLLEQGDVSLRIEGPGAAAGDYIASVTALTSAPSLVGRPTQIEVGREGGGGGIGGISLSAVLDHTGPTLRDSLFLDLRAVELPEVDLGAFGGRLGLGTGRSTVSMLRQGDQLDVRMRWVSEDVVWSGGGPSAGGAPPTRGSANWARDLVWRTLTGIGRVEMEMALAGDVARPRLSVTSNLGSAVSASLGRELGREIEAAEAQARAEVDRRIQPLVQEARGRADVLRLEVLERVAAERREVDELRARLEARVQELARMLPGD